MRLLVLGLPRVRRIEPSAPGESKPTLALAGPQDEVAWQELKAEPEGYGVDVLLPTAGHDEFRLFPTGSSDETSFKVIYVKPSVRGPWQHLPQV